MPPHAEKTTPTAARRAAAPRRRRPSAATLLLLMLAAIPLAPATATAKLVVACTTSDLGAIARDVAGDDADVLSLVPHHQDPHYVDAKPSLVLRLSRVDALVINGLGLEEGWLPPLLRGARNAAILPGAAGHIDASAAVTVLGRGAGAASRAGGDVHPGGNPHYLHDPRAGADIARALGARFATLDPAHAAGYLARGQALHGQLVAIAAAETKRFATLPTAQRGVVVYHASLVYVTDWLGLRQLATVEPLPGIPPNPSHVATVRRLIAESGARALLQERYYPRKVSETLARLAKIDLVLLPGGCDEAAKERYPARIQRMANAIFEALR